MIPFDKALFEVVKPRTLDEFAEKVLRQPLPPLQTVGEWWAYYGLGPKAFYLGTRQQNQILLQRIASAAQS